MVFSAAVRDVLRFVTRFTGVTGFVRGGGASGVSRMRAVSVLVFVLVFILARASSSALASPPLPADEGERAGSLESISVPVPAPAPAPVLATASGTVRARLYAASSLEPVLKRALERAFQSEFPDETLELALIAGASGNLARQLSYGAPADLFISADHEWIMWLASRRPYASGERFLENRLVLVVARSAPVDFLPLSDFPVYCRRLAMGEPALVPAGRYGQEVLMKLGLWESFQGRLIFYPHVRSVARATGLDSTLCGLTYRTDGRVDANIKIVYAFENSLHAPITYWYGSFSPTGVLLGELLYHPIAQEEFAGVGFETMARQPTSR